MIKGTLKAPSDPAIFFTDHWIRFRYVDQLVVEGDGYLDGQGASAWQYNNCKNNPRCKRLPPVHFVTDSAFMFLFFIFILIRFCFYLF